MMERRVVLSFTCLSLLSTIIFSWSGSSVSRRVALVTPPRFICGPVQAFEGGVGGLGKTKPETGVVLSSSFIPSQSDTGVVTAEVETAGTPVLVTFTSPWPLLLTTSGGSLETRNVQSSASAFVQVIEATTPSSIPASKAATLDLLEPIFAPQGKFGAYGSPFDVRVKELLPSSSTNLSFTCSVTFTTFTPGMRETERQVLVKGVQASSVWVLLVTGTSQQSFIKQRPLFEAVVNSFEAVPAPRRSSSKVI